MILENKIRKYTKRFLYDTFESKGDDIFIDKDSGENITIGSIIKETKNRFTIDTNILTEVFNSWVLEQLDSEPQDELNQKEWVQDVVDKVYPHIVTTLGPSNYEEETPNVEIWNDIYARYSGIPEMRGEDSKKTKAEWKGEDNTIYVYYLNMLDIEDIIRSLLHEYTHFLQDPDPEKRKEQRKLGYDGDQHEIEAHAAEESWEDYLVYLEDTPQTDTIIEAQEDRETGEDLEDKLDGDDAYIDNTDFTKTDIVILNYITKKLSKGELDEVANNDYYNTDSSLFKKYSNLIKLFGVKSAEVTGDEGDWAKSARYAKWAIDNWDAAQTEDFDDDSLDYSRVTNPLKIWPSLFYVSATETGWERTYRTGTIEIAAYDREDAEDRAHNSWWDYEPDMETTDYGDYDADDFEIDDIQHEKILKEHKEKDLSPDLEIGDRIMVWDLTPDDAPPGGYDRTVEIPRTLIGTVTDSLDDDEIDLESFRGGIKYMVRDDSTGEEYGLYRGENMGGSIYPIADKYHPGTRDKWVKLPQKQNNPHEEIINESLEKRKNLLEFKTNLPNIDYLLKEKYKKEFCGNCIDIFTIENNPIKLLEERNNNTLEDLLNKRQELLGKLVKESVELDLVHVKTEKTDKEILESFQLITNNWCGFNV